MINKVKAKIQGNLNQKCLMEYQDELRCQSNPYLMWINETEKKGNVEKEEMEYPSLSVVYIEDCQETFSIKDASKEILVFVSKGGRIASHAFEIIDAYFTEHPQMDIAYCDEDIWMRQTNEEGLEADDDAQRMCPWVKPMWSPETFMSFFYFGNIFAIRVSAFKELEWLATSDCYKNIYDFMLKATEKTERVGHIERVLFHKYVSEGNREEIQEQVMNTIDMIGCGPDFDDIKLDAYKRRGIPVHFVHDETKRFSYPVFEVTDDDLVSIIIPSKDNVNVLSNCIHSIVEYTSYPKYEIIVVDNGSSPENKVVVERMKEVYGFTYVYQPMPFNFSAMCNLGAEIAKGNLLLLLNDDMEVIQGDWLHRLAGAAKQRNVGAVGAKLLYPDSTMIQHVGITNTVDGPGHKLKLMDDSKSYYYGHNKLIYDMIGVTAACMMIRKNVFVKIGGLFHGLQVAYNDVDLCFRLCEMRMRNVQRNDVVLYHHESLSRGDDMQDDKKMERLMQEKEILYQRHKRLYMLDPYCGRNMNSGRPEYECRNVYGFEYADETEYQDHVTLGKALPAEDKMNNAIMVVVEDARKETLRTAGSKRVPYYICKGWCYVPGMDNSRYKYTLKLRNKENGEVWEIPVVKRYRKDVEDILPDETNVALTGFVCWIYQGSMPAGTYEVWMFAKDQCSRQKLYRNTEKELIIE